MNRRSKVPAYTIALGIGATASMLEQYAYGFEMPPLRRLVQSGPTLMVRPRVGGANQARVVHKQVAQSFDVTCGTGLEEGLGEL